MSEKSSEEIVNKLRLRGLSLQGAADEAVRRLKALDCVVGAEAEIVISVTVRGSRARAREIYAVQAEIMHDLEANWEFDLVYEEPKARRGK